MNVLGATRINPRLSAYAYIFRKFDFKFTPMAPPVTKVLAHLKLGQRPTWTLHGEQGWTTCPALHHYRFLTCYFPRENMERQVGKVTFFPTVILFPKVKI